LCSKVILNQKLKQISKAPTKGKVATKRVWRWLQKKMEEFRRNEPADGVEHGHASASLETNKAKTWNQ
jgi:hypothetical protein